MEKYLQIATDWWANKIKGRTRHDNGALNELPSFVACALADMGTKKVTEEQVDIFKNALAANIAEEFANHGYSGPCCDYGPDIILGKAAKEAGISELNFPFKTKMHIRRRGGNLVEIEVKEGYGAPWTTIGKVRMGE